MTFRILNSSCTFLGNAPAGSQVSSKLEAGPPGLLDFVTSQTKLSPKVIEASYSGGGTAANVIVTECIIRSITYGTEVAHRLYYNINGIPLPALMAQLGLAAAKAGAMTPLKFLAEGGIELVFTYAGDPGASPANDVAMTNIWDCQNQLGGETFEVNEEAVG